MPTPTPWRYQSINKRRERDSHEFWGEVSRRFREQATQPAPRPAPRPRAAPEPPSDDGGGFLGGVGDFLGGAADAATSIPGVGEAAGFVGDVYGGATDVLQAGAGIISGATGYDRKRLPGTDDYYRDKSWGGKLSGWADLFTDPVGTVQEAEGAWEERMRDPGLNALERGIGGAITAPETYALAGFGGALGGAVRGAGGAAAPIYRRAAASVVEPVVGGSFGRRAIGELGLEAGARTGAELGEERFGLAGSLAGGLAGGLGGAQVGRAVPRSAGAQTVEQVAPQLGQQVIGGGAIGYARKLRPLEEVANEVHTLENSTVRSILKNSKAYRINPSLLETSDVGKASVGYQVQRIASEGLSEGAVAASIGKYQPRGGFRDAVGPNGSIFEIDDTASIKNLPGTPKGSRTWYDVFSKPHEYDLTERQRNYVNDFNQVIDDMEALRVEAGLEPFPRLEDGSLYVPRQVRGIRGTELPRPSNNKLLRLHEEAAEGVANGVRYETDPRAVLKLYTRNTYREIAEKQLSDYLEPHSIAPSELVPEKVSARLREAIQKRKAAEKVVRQERSGIMRRRSELAKQMQREFRNLTAAKARVAMLREQMKREGVRGASERMRAAQDAANASEGRLKKMRAESKTLPRVQSRKSAPFAGLSQNARSQLESAQVEAKKAQKTYSRHVEAAKQSKVADKEVFEPLRGKERSTRTAYLKASRKANRMQAGDAKDRALADAADARAQWEQAKAVVEEARVNVDGPTFGEREAPIPIEQWRNRFYRKEDAERLKETVDPQSQVPNSISKAVEVVGNVTRTGASVGDFAMPFIQGLPILARNPQAWAKLTKAHYQAFYDPSVMSRYISENIDTINEMTAHGVPIANDEFFIGLENIGSLSNKISSKATFTEKPLAGAGKVARQTFGRFQSSYQTGLTVGRTELWKASKGASLWEGKTNELAAYVRNMTGGLDTRALGVSANQRGWESMWLAFSPRLLRSTLALVSDAATAPRSAKGQESLRALGQLAAGATGMYVLSGLALGKDWEDIERGLNPLNGKEFLSHQVNGDWIGIGGQVRAITQLVAKVATDPQGLASTDQFDNPLLGFYMSRGAPALNIVGSTVEATTGLDAMKYDDISSVPDLAKHIGTSALPFAVQGILEGESAMTSVAALGGARASAATPTDKLNEIAQRQFDEREFYNLEPSQQDSIKRQHPDIWDEAVEKGSSERKEAEAFKARLAEQQQADDELLRQGQISLQEWKAGYNERSQRMRIMQNVIYGDDAGGDDTPLDQYYQVVEDSKVNGRVDWDQVESWTQRQTEKDRKYIERNTNVGGMTELVRQYRETSDKRNEYYSLPRYRGFSGEEAQQIDELYDRARASLGLPHGRKAPTAQMLRALSSLGEDYDPRILTGARRRVLGHLKQAKHRERYLQSNPDAALFIGGGYLSPQQVSMLRS